MTQQTAFDILLEAITNSSATHEEKIEILEKIKEYINYHSEKIMNIIKK